MKERGHMSIVIRCHPVCLIILHYLKHVESIHRGTEVHTV